MINESRLALILSYVKEHTNPNYFLQQYMITPAIAAKVLIIARKDIFGKIVFDLGCGTGRFSIGAALIGAKLVNGFDIDKSVIELAKESLKVVESKVGIKLSHICKFEVRNVFEINEKCDTVIQFPPIDYDIEFFEKALEIARKVYSIHINSKRKIEDLKKINDNIRILETFNYPLFNKENGEITRGVILVNI